MNKILTKSIIAAYAGVILDIMEHQPSKENTKNISETIEELYADWDNLYDYGKTPAEKADEYAEVATILDKLSTIAAEYVVADDYLDYDCDDMVYGLIQLIRIGKE